MQVREKTLSSHLKAGLITASLLTLAVASCASQDTEAQQAATPPEAQQTQAEPSPPAETKVTEMETDKGPSGKAIDHFPHGNDEQWKREERAHPEPSGHVF